MDVRLTVPERGVGSLPALLRQNFATGKLRADAHATGTLLAPNVDLTASLRRSRLGASSLAAPIDVDLSGTYDGKRADLHVQASDTGGGGNATGGGGAPPNNATGGGGAPPNNATGRELAAIDAQLDVPVAQIVDGPGPPAWQASGRMHFAAFPLESIAWLDDKQVAGAVTGDIDLQGLHGDARMAANVTVDGLRVGTFSYKAARVTANAGGGAFDLAARIDQDDGFAEAKTHAQASWGAAMAPSLDPSRPLAVTLAAKGFRIGLVAPLVEGVLDQLDGRVDADARLEIDPVARAPRLSGSLTLSGGIVEAAAGGGPLHDVGAHVTFSPEGTIAVDKLTAAGATGRLEGSGSAKLRGVALASAQVQLTVPRASPIPLTAGGAGIGDVDGRISVTEATAADGKTMSVKVEMRGMRVALSEVTANSVQSLGPMAKVKVKARRGVSGDAALVPLDAAKEQKSAAAQAKAISVEVDVGDVEVTRGTELKVDLSGKVNATAGATTAVTGHIEIRRGGTLDVQGRTFLIENGTVTFVGGDPSNPEVVVKASWTAPDGTVVYATFSGPLKTGGVTLTSSPLLSQQDILELLLFGTTSGKQGASAGGDAAESAGLGAAGVVGGQATQPLNHALKQLGLGAVSTNIDTSQSANPKPEVEVQISKTISLQVAAVLGTILPGVNPDRTLFTVDWRFLANWSLVSTYGDAGTTIFDVLWQHRY
jgi:translocation and assembly module TamB